MFWDYSRRKQQNSQVAAILILIGGGFVTLLAIFDSLRAWLATVDW